MHVRRLTLPLLALVTAAVVIGAAPAEAAVVTTDVGSVSLQPFTLTDLAGGSGGTATVSGTSSAHGSAVDLECYRGTSRTLLTAGVPTGPSGTWSWSGSYSPLQGLTCTLLAVPAGTNPSDLTPFTGGRRLGFATTRSQAWTATTVAPGQAGTATLETPGECGLSGVVADAASGSPGASALSCVGSYSLDDSTTDAVSHATVNQRSGVRVDGVMAVGPDDLHELGAAASAPAPTRTITDFSSGDGSMTVDDTERWSTCADPSWPATAAKCATVTDAGVALHRRTTIDHDGRVATVVDTWSSTDGQAHALDLETGVAGGTSTALTQVPWIDGTPGTHPSGQTFGPGPHEPTSVVVAQSASPALASPIATATFSMPAVGGVYASGVTYLDFTRTVPAGGSASMSTTYAWGTTAGEVSAIAAAASLAARPHLAIDPVPTILSTKVLTVTGSVTAGAGDRPTSVGLIGGGTAPVGSDGRWRLTTPVSAGADTVTVVTSDDAGLSDTETASTYARNPLTVGTTVKLGKTKYTRGALRGQVKAYTATFTLTCASDAASCPTTFIVRNGLKTLLVKALTVRHGTRATTVLALPTSFTPVIRRLGAGRHLTLTLEADTRDPAGAPFVQTSTFGVKR